MIRLLPLLLLAVLFSACERQNVPQNGNGAQSGPLAFPSTTIVDLSHSFNAGTIYWPTEAGFKREITAQGMTEQGYYYEAGSFTSAEHGGTHLDAPVHFVEGAPTVDAIPVDRLMGPGVVIDVTSHAAANPDYRISKEDIQTWESQQRPIPDGAIVLFRTGFGKFWPDRQRYLGTRETGAAAVSQLHFPGLHPEAAEWLLMNRSVRAVGIDTPSIDYGQSQLFRTHRILFEQNVPALENVANLDQVPVQGALILALPMKIEDGSGAPVRIIAFVP